MFKQAKLFSFYTPVVTHIEEGDDGKDHFQYKDKEGKVCSIDPVKVNPFNDRQIMHDELYSLACKILKVNPTHEGVVGRPSFQAESSRRLASKVASKILEHKMNASSDTEGCSESSQSSAFSSSTLTDDELIRAEIEKEFGLLCICNNV